MPPRANAARGRMLVVAQMLAAFGVALASGGSHAGAAVGSVARPADSGAGAGTSGVEDAFIRPHANPFKRQGRDRWARALPILKRRRKKRTAEVVATNNSPWPEITGGAKLNFLLCNHYKKVHFGQPEKRELDSPKNVKWSKPGTRF